MEKSIRIYRDEQFKKKKKNEHKKESKELKRSKSMSNIKKPQTDGLAEHKTQEQKANPLETKITATTKAIQDSSKKIDSELNNAERSSTKQAKDSKDLREKYKKNIQNALNMMKKLAPKKSWDILKDGIPVPKKAAEELLTVESFYDKQIDKHSHASVPAKLKNIFGVTEKEGSPEKTRRKYLKENVIALGATLEAYVYFFIGCLNAGAIFNSILVKFNNIIKKLGPKGKGYIDSKQALRADPSWTTRYNEELVRLSRSYCFGKVVDTNINFYTETGPYTLYKHRVKMVYTMCRDKATEFKQQMLEALTGLFDKFKSGSDNSFLLSNNEELPNAYKSMRDHLKKLNGDIAEIAKIMSQYSKIFSDPSVENKTSLLLAQMNDCMTHMGNLSAKFAKNNAIFIMTTGNDTFNKSTADIFNRAKDLFDSLKDLKESLSDGDYSKARSTLELFNKRLLAATKQLESYKDLISKINDNTLEARQYNDIQSMIDNANLEFNRYKDKFTEALGEAKQTPEAYQKRKIQTAIEYATRFIAGCSAFLGPYASILTQLVSGFGPTVGMKVADWHYAN